MPTAEYDRLYEKLQSLPPVFGRDIKASRAEMEKAAAKFFPVSDEVTCQPVDANGVSAEWVTPKEDVGEGVILMLHGGGYCIGSIASYRNVAGNLARIAKRKTLLIEYRLSPEHPFPAALDDAATAYNWLLDQGVKPNHITIVGDSAGGNLTLTTLLRLREDDVALPAVAVAISPWTDLTGSGESARTRVEEDPLIKPDRTNYIAEWYHRYTDIKHPLVSPLFADLTGLPPLLIQVGTRETLLDDSTRFAEAARNHGVEVDLQIWDDMFHVWHYYADWIPEGIQAFEQIAQFIDSRIGS